MLRRTQILRYLRLRYLGWASLALAFAAAAFTLYLDSRVRSEFEGRRFALPARIYARPLELHVGLRIPQPRLPRGGARRRVRLVRAQRQRARDRAAGVCVLGRAAAGEAPARGVRGRRGHGAARRRGRRAATRAPGAFADRWHLPGEQRGPGAGQARRGAATFFS